MKDNQLHTHNSIVQHRQFKEIKAEIERIMKLSIEVGEPMCVALEGCTGAGKTTLVQTIIRDLKQDDPGTEVFYMMTPANVTVKGMVSGMLYQLGDPNFDKGRLSTLDARLRRYLCTAGTKLVILDDIQHMVTNRTTKSAGRVVSVTEWLKVFIKELNIPFVVIAIEHQVEKLFEANDQLSRLFVSRRTLKPFQFDSAQAKQEFYYFVSFYAETLGVDLFSSVDDTQKEMLLSKIYLVTRGVVNSVTKLLTISAHTARGNGSDIITEEILHSTASMRVFESRDNDGKLVSSNPFVADLMQHVSEN